MGESDEELDESGSEGYETADEFESEEEEERITVKTCRGQAAYTVSRNGVLFEIMQRPQGNSVDELQVGSSCLGKRKRAPSEDSDEIGEEVSVARPSPAITSDVRRKAKRRRTSSFTRQ